MMTRADAVQVAAARSSSRTGDVRALESPPTRIGGRPPPPPPPPPVPLPSNCNCRSQRIVTAAVSAILVAPSRRESDEQAVPAHAVHAAGLHQPGECLAAVQLGTGCRVEPETGAPPIRPSPLASC